MSPPFDNKIHFALTLLNQSSPSLRIFKSAIIEEQLAKCMSDYLKKRIKLDLTKKKVRKILTPNLKQLTLLVNSRLFFQLFLKLIQKILNLHKDHY